MKLVDQETLPRMDPGIDWGAARRVLIRSPKGLLVIRKGHSRANGAWGFGSIYEPTRLILQERAKGIHHGHWLSEGRITLPVVMLHAPLITAVFGTAAWKDKLDVRKTLVIE